jgi:hypothetical protein
MLSSLQERFAAWMGPDIQGLVRKHAAVVEEQIGFTDFSLDRFRDWVAALYRRPILCEPLAMHPDFSGAWVRTPVADVVFYEAETTSLHQAHIQLHELCHILLDHGTLVIDVTVLGVVRHILMHGIEPFTHTGDLPFRLRSRHTNAEEKEAEALASLIHHKALRARMAPAVDLPVSSSETLLRMYRSMGWV